jgi:hypothetical protein
MDKKCLHSWELNSNLKKIHDGEIEVLTYVNKPNGYFEHFLKSADKYNYPLKIIGWNTEWKGFGSKLIGIYNYLNTLDESYLNKYMLLVDAYDVIFLKDYKELVNQFKKSNYDIIFSSNYITKENFNGNEIKRFYFNFFLMLFFNVRTKEHHLNAGVYLIKIKVYKEIFEKYLPTCSIDDQRLFTRIVRENKNYNILIDHKSSYFLSQDKLLEDYTKCLNRVFNKEITPFTIHGNGRASLKIIIEYLFSECDIQDPNASFISLLQYPVICIEFLFKSIPIILFLFILIFYTNS